MITFYSVPRPFDGEFDELQRMAAQSWASAVDGAQIVLMGDESGVAEVCKEYGWQHARTLPLNRHGTPMLSGAFYLAEIMAQHSLLCEISADIVPGGDFAQALDDIAEIERPFVVGQRWDIEPGAPPESAVLHPPSAADYFIYRRGTLGEIPPFAYGRMVYDNWLIWAAIERWDLTVIDATASITAIHTNHGYPEYGSRENMQASDERQENIRLAHESGCHRWYEVTDAPFALEGGRVLEKVIA
ncbi:MAG: hypothetical protein ACYSW0_25735 [Planctomycetota bacterium]|jgi:hypothetical protein